MTSKFASILANVQTSLALIDAPVYSGSLKSVNGIETPYKAPQQTEDEDRPFANVGQVTDDVTAEANLKTLKRMTFPVEVIVTYDPDDPATSRAAAEDLMGDVVAALLADPTRGGYAIDTGQISGARHSMVEATGEKHRPGYVSTEQAMYVDYGHSRTDPSAD